MPKRICLPKRKAIFLPENTVNVSNPGPWGNPFRVGVHGTEADCVNFYDQLMAGCICIEHNNWRDQRSSYYYVQQNIHTLRGKNLACWCPLHVPCHADILIKLAN